MVGERGRLEGRRCGNGGLRARRVLFARQCEPRGWERGGATFPYKYDARPERWVAGREGHEDAMGTGVFETRAARAC